MKDVNWRVLWHNSRQFGYGKPFWRCETHNNHFLSGDRCHACALEHDYLPITSPGRSYGLKIGDEVMEKAFDSEKKGKVIRLHSNNNKCTLLLDDGR